MGHAAGKRAGTRYAFSRDFRKKGMINLGTYMRQYQLVDECRATETKKLTLL